MAKALPIIFFNVCVLKPNLINQWFVVVTKTNLCSTLTKNKNGFGEI